MKNFIKAVLLSSAFAMIFGVPSYQAQAQGNTLLKQLQDKILDFGDCTYNKKNYENLLQEIDEAAEISEKVEKSKEDLIWTLKCQYFGNITCVMGNMLDGKCNDHRLLKDLRKEYDNLAKMDISEVGFLLHKSQKITPDDVALVKKRHNKHNEINKFIDDTKKSRVKNVTLTSEYDKEYTTNSLKKAKNFDAERVSNNLGCESMENGLKKIPGYLNDRHVDFLERIIKLYVDGDHYDEIVEDGMLRRVQEYYYNDDASGEYKKYGIDKTTAKANTDVLEHKIKDFKTVMNMLEAIKDELSAITENNDALDVAKIDTVLAMYKQCEDMKLNGKYIDGFQNDMCGQLNNFHKEYLTYVVDNYVGNGMYDEDSELDLLGQIVVYYDESSATGYYEKYMADKTEAEAFANGLIDKMNTLKEE